MYEIWHSDFDEDYDDDSHPEIPVIDEDEEEDDFLYLEDDRY